MLLPTVRCCPSGYGADGHRFAPPAATPRGRRGGWTATRRGLDRCGNGGGGRARVVRRWAPVPIPNAARHAAEFVFTFVLDGGITLQRGDDAPVRLGEGDSFTMPAHMDYVLSTRRSIPAPDVTDAVPAA